ncbi:uncharacterized protein K02A2.6-like [Toxorhynchites rutilus septentrionalis]|uniref:uncharacterized protein K02A2.6-like n=1 Tax=Toxorhynchites rutilus septentrionalis TaxID=329112 RepID=UPI0024785A5B|nr:uncharacterized protein K02A2.6-like [Toxorhynchites rutilus septentrionalis]
MLVDSGADANLVTEDAWETFEKQRISVVSSTRGSTRVLRAYGSQNVLTIRGSFVADIVIGENRVQVEFFVVVGGQRCLLGDSTAKKLGVLRVGLNDNSVEAKPFTKIKEFRSHIRIDPQAVPVFQPMRRIPILLDEMLSRDIIEIKTGPTTWVSPLVVVGKANGEPRLCLDLRRVNEAVLRAHHPMPVIEDYLAKLGRGRLWSKLDIKEAFLQVELDEASRDATTFITVRGLFCFKRLPFGLVTVPELFQKTMDETLSGCIGISMIVEGQNLNVHDERLNKVM